MKSGVCFSLMLLCLLPAAQGMALRCDKGLVDVGDRKSIVLARCGTPVFTHLTAVETTTGASTGGTASEVPVEQWSYNFGPKAFLQILTFHGDVLTRIEPGVRVPTSGNQGERLLASIGDTLAEVRQKNGEPYYEERVGTETETVAAAGKGKPEVTREVAIDRWTYRFGPGRFMQILTFKGDRLTQIENGPRE